VAATQSSTASFFAFSFVIEVIWRFRRKLIYDKVFRSPTGLFVAFCCFRFSCEYYLDCCILFVIVVYVVSLCSIIWFIICYGLEWDPVVMHRYHDLVDVFGSSTKSLQAVHVCIMKTSLRRNSSLVISKKIS